MNTQTAKMVKIDQRLLEPTPHPAPIYLNPENCPVVLGRYEAALDNCNLKLFEIKEAEKQTLKKDR